MSRTYCDVSIITSGHDVADARLHREAEALVAAGLKVEVFGLGDAAVGPVGTTVRTWPRVGGVRRLALAGRMASRANGRVLMSLDPDSALAAHTAVLASGRELVVDVHEDYAALLDDRAWTAAFGGMAGRAAHEIVRGFQRVAGRAALTVVADEYVPPLRARRRLVLPNEPDLSMLPEPAEPGGTPRALYVGDVRRSRGLFAMLEAIRLAPGWELDIVGPVAPSDEDQLLTVLAQDDLAARVRLHGRKPPRDAWTHATGAWLGMLLLADTPAFRDALPSKVGEYLACGLPIVTTGLPRQAAVVRGSATGSSSAATHDAHRPLGIVVEGGDDAAVGARVGERLRRWDADSTELLEMREATLEAAARRAAAPDSYALFAAAVVDVLDASDASDPDDAGDAPASTRP